MEPAKEEEEKKKQALFITRILSPLDLMKEIWSQPVATSVTVATRSGIRFSPRFQEGFFECQAVNATYHHRALVLLKDVVTAICLGRAILVWNCCI